MYTAEGHFDRAQLVQQYTPLVKRIAHHLMARLPANVQLEDLIQNGMIGLLDAFARYEDGFGAQFETYSSQRIRGAMLDGLRNNDWLPRSLRHEMRRVEVALRQLEQQNGRAPSERELADSMGMSLAEYQKLLLEAKGQQLVYIEDYSSDDGDNFLERHMGSSDEDPYVLLEDKDLRQNLVKIIETLPEREQLIMALYYDEDLNLKEIGEVMNLSESRVCQMHSQAIARIRSKLFADENQEEKG